MSREVSGLLYGLSEAVIARLGYSTGGAPAYGEDFENSVFMLHRYCWCEMDECPWCLGSGPAPEAREHAPNFLHKPTGVQVRWYKYIGRGMEVEGECDWPAVIHECIASLEAA